ncbi:hypothetical protein [Streptomyces sp. NPDC018352]|uniref:hypothetical protein n=1 Tax=Streptomyces sp. NPDC018352 TaxID=3157194 RepID=UPI003408A011
MTAPTAICAEYSTHTAEQQPVAGPCVLRPNHLGHIHQDMRGVQWATRPDRTPGHPATCPTSPTGWHHYNEGNGRPESRTCDHCGAGGCCACGGGPVVYRNHLEQPFCWPCADGQASPATCSGSADELQVRLHAALRVIGRAEREITELCQRLAETEQGLKDVQEGRREWAALCAKAIRRQVSAEGAVARGRALAGRWQSQGRPYSLYARDVLDALNEQQ